ncbi:pyridoxal phosphate phosphatase PHOSPHO2-like [Teleopsis dalmanni]|uniref:pyridoxal phosphate phosphatase PHOSPHO2-like n=1 Tax=Teleopsis dalmanni TaxID=139649 RepID=UPI0018CEBB4C|nr:pyridoxal phosphate phosphatase PHOSPHO2-like [Teleopsis dalmanni]XP_037934993.1 pyridoxal phosphate phosphatase PHOSPHO2-like [Teleopsis dalmanni]
MAQQTIPLTTKKYLIAFDFDCTIVAQNTDTVVRDLLPQNLLTSDVNKLIETVGWTQYMQKIFHMLHEEKVTKYKICDAVRAIPEVPGFVRLIKRLKQQNNFDLIIISDSNSIFIDEWLKAHNLSEHFLQVFTNPAVFNEHGLLGIKPYHHQTTCHVSAPNLCKKQVLERFLTKQDLHSNIRYDNLIYVGDGSNDFCPITKLGSTDIACAREGFALEKKFRKHKDQLRHPPLLVIWENGFDLLEQLEKMLFHKDEAQ